MPALSACINTQYPPTCSYSYLSSAGWIKSYGFHHIMHWANMYHTCIPCIPQPTTPHAKYHFPSVQTLGDD